MRDGELAAEIPRSQLSQDAIINAMAESNDQVNEGGAGGDT
jgi:hypothetical protein